MSETGNKDKLTKSLDEMNQNLQGVIKINDTIEKGYVKPKEMGKNEDRKFQIEVLRLQLKYDNANTTMSLILGLIIAVLAVVITTTFSDVVPQNVRPLASLVGVGLIVATFLIALFIGVYSRYNQKNDLEILEDKFIKQPESQKPTPKEPDNP